MKLRVIAGALICILLAALTAVPALADVIWEPNDTFYQKEYKNCEYEGRSYTADGGDGTVDVLQEPGSKKTVAEINNGSVFYVSFKYTDNSDDAWGVVEFIADAAGNAVPDYSYEGQTGWVRMAELKLVYDYIAFHEDHQSEFVPFTGIYDDLKSYDQLVFWTYPGSGVTDGTLDTQDLDEYFEITDTYTDEDGTQWGYVEYWRYIRNAWLCLSDPMGAGIEQVAVSTPPEASPSSSQQPTSAASTPPGVQPPAVPKDQTPMLLLISGIVVAVVLVTGVLIAVFWKKNRKDGV